MSKQITSKHYHLWTDALHARALARKSDDEWDRGTYVRWTVNTAWTVFEVVCEDVTGEAGFGMRFKERLNKALEKLGFNRLQWGEGIWQKVANLYKVRKLYTHIGMPNDSRFPDADVAEDAIVVIREAIKKIHIHCGREPPEWVNDDKEYGQLNTGVRIGTPTLLHTHRDARGLPKEGTVRIVVVSQGEEKETDYLPPWTSYEPCVKKIEESATASMTAVRVYYGHNLIEEREVLKRGL